MLDLLEEPVSTVLESHDSTWLFPWSAWLARGTGFASSGISAVQETSLAGKLWLLRIILYKAQLFLWTIMSVSKWELITAFNLEILRNIIKSFLFAYQGVFSRYFGILLSNTILCRKSYNVQYLLIWQYFSKVTSFNMRNFFTNSLSIELEHWGIEIVFYFIISRKFSPSRYLTKKIKGNMYLSNYCWCQTSLFVHLDIWYKYLKQNTSQVNIKLNP